MPLQEMLNQLKEKYGDKYGWAVISAEDHEAKEGDMQCGVHRHAQIFAKKRFQTKNPRFWDLEWDDKVFHPCYKPTDNKKNSKHDVMSYVIKDGNYIQDGHLKEGPFDVKSYLESVKTKQGYGFTYLANEIKAGKTIYELDDVIPGFIANHKRKIEEYIQFQEEKKRHFEVKPKFPGFQIETRMPYDWELIANWANDNFLKPRAPRQPQLWIWSREPEMGKTYPWAILLRQYYNCYEWCYSSKQDKSILDCDYILLDELKGGITVGDLKSLSQMYGMNLDIKYGNITQFKKNVPLIITSNRPPREIYTKHPNEEMTSLESRFLIINVSDPYHLKIKEPQEQFSPTTTNLLLGSPESQLVNLDTQATIPYEAPIIIEERDEDEHSEFSNEEFEKAERLRRNN
jgi:hypothetical protein